MKYKDLKIVERRRAEKGIPRVHRNSDSYYYGAEEPFKENSVRELKALAEKSGINPKDLYISYTRLDKIGINPRSGYETPLGIYCYPYEYAMREFGDSEDPSNVPYMGEQPYIWLFTPKNVGRGLELADLDTATYNEAFDKIVDFVVSKGMDGGYALDIVEQAINTAKEVYNVSAFSSSLWNITRVLGEEFATFKVNNPNAAPGSVKGTTFEVGQWVKLPASYGSDNAYGVISSINKTTANVKEYYGGKLSNYTIYDVPLKDLKAAKQPAEYIPQPHDFLYQHKLDKANNDTVQDFPAPKENLNINDQVEVVKGPFDGFNGVVMASDNEFVDVKFTLHNKEFIQQFPTEWLKKADNTTESIIKEESNSQSGASGAIIEWNRLLRVAGFDFVVDRNHAGLIHPAEPTQAVFLSKNFLEVIGKVKNTASKGRNAPYTSNELHSGKYDPVTFEKWLKANYKNYHPYHLPDNSITIKSPKLLKALIAKNADWADKIKGVDPAVALESLQQKVISLIKKNDSWDLDDAYRKLSNTYENSALDITTLKNYILEIADKNPDKLAQFLEKIELKERWTEAEPMIAKNGEAAYRYISKYIKGPWKAAEPALAKDPELAYQYATNYLLEAFPLGEEVISKNAYYSYRYAMYGLDMNRFEKGEPAILKDPDTAIKYAKNIIKGRWPEAETILKSSPRLWKEYSLNVNLAPNPNDIKVGESYALVNGDYFVLVSVVSVDGSVATISSRGYKSEVSISNLLKIEEDRYGYTLGQKLGNYTLISAGLNSYKLENENNNQSRTVKKIDVWRKYPQYYNVQKTFIVGDYVFADGKLGVIEDIRQNDIYRVEFLSYYGLNSYRKDEITPYDPSKENLDDVITDL